MIRLDGPLLETFDDPVLWVDALRRAGCSAAYCPLDAGAPVLPSLTAETFEMNVESTRAAVAAKVAVEAP